MVNITGCFILGFFVTLLAERVATPRVEVLRLFIAIGFVGSYTTFSTLEFDTSALIETGSLLRAFGNAFGSLIAGFIAIRLGVTAGRTL